VKAKAFICIPRNERGLKTSITYDVEILPSFIRWMISVWQKWRYRHDEG